MRARFPIWCARLRMPLLWGAAVFRVGTVRRSPVEVGAPVAGRWEAVNSPADKVPGLST
jgi:hypothetical protein